MSESTTIDERAEQAIEQLSETFGSEESDLRERYEEYREKFAEMEVSDPSLRALRRLSLDEKGGTGGSTKRMRGVVLGAGDPWNTSERKVEDCKTFIKKQGLESAVRSRMVKRNKEGTVEPGMASVTVTDEDGEEIDFYVLETNERSPNAGEPLPEKDLIRWVYGAALDDGEWHLFETILNGERGREPPVPPLHQPVEFEASVGNSPGDRNTTRLRVDDPDPFEPVDAGVDVGDLFEEGAVHIEALENVDADYYGRNDLIVTKGTVTFMELSPDEGQNRRVVITDPFAWDSDKSVTCFVPDHVEIDFQDGSDVYVVGQVSPSSSDEYDDSINAVGLYADDEFRVDNDAMSFDDFEVEDDDDEEAGGSEEEDAPEPDPGPEPEAEEVYLPPPGEIAEMDDYNMLRSLAVGFDDIPGSGIDKEELRKKLIAKANETHTPPPAEGKEDDEDGAAADDEPAEEPGEGDEWEW